MSILAQNAKVRKNMIAVICGASGLVGSQLLRALLQDTEISQIVSVGRKSVKIQNPKLKEVLISSLAELSANQQELKGDIYFCCLGTTIKAAGSQENFKKVDFTAVVDFAKVASLNTCKSFSVVSASGANPRSMIYYNRIKGEMEEAVKALNLKRVIIFQPSLLLGKRTESRKGESLAIAIFHMVAPFLSRSLMKRLTTSPQHLAKRLLEESKRADPGIVTINAQNI